MGFKYTKTVDGKVVEEKRMEVMTTLKLEAIKGLAAWEYQEGDVSISLERVRH